MFTATMSTTLSNLWLSCSYNYTTVSLPKGKWGVANSRSYQMQSGIQEGHFILGFKEGL